MRVEPLWRSAQRWWPVSVAVVCYLLLPSLDHSGCDGGSPAPIQAQESEENRARKGLSTDLCRWKETGWNTHYLLLWGGFKFTWSQIVWMNKDGAEELFQFCCFSRARRCESKGTAYPSLPSNARITHGRSCKASVRLPAGWACCWEDAAGAAVPSGSPSATRSCYELHYPWICTGIWPLVRDSEQCLFLSWEPKGNFPGEICKDKWQKFIVPPLSLLLCLTPVLFPNWLPLERHFWEYQKVWLVLGKIQPTCFETMRLMVVWVWNAQGGGYWWILSAAWQPQCVHSLEHTRNSFQRKNGVPP